VRSVFSIILIVAFLQVRAQIPVFNFQKSDTARIIVSLNGGVAQNSNTIKAQMFNHFYQGKFITNEVKENSSKKLKNKNRFGGDAFYGLSVQFKTDTLFNKTGYKLHFALNNRYHINSRFSNDAFRLFWFGNKEFYLKTADFSNFNFNYLEYQQLQLGLSKTWANSKGALLLSVLNGNDNIDFKIKKGLLHVPEDFESLDFELNFELNRSAAKPAFFSNKGLSVDFYFQSDFDFHFKSTSLTFSARDIGFINWSNKSTQIRKDTVFQFEGITVTDLFQLNDSSFQSSSLDSLIEKNISKKNKSYYTVLPAIFNIDWKQHINNKIEISEGIVFRYTGNMLPLVYTGIAVNTARGTFTGTVFYGGYGNFSLGFNYKTLLIKSWELELGTQNLNGLLLPGLFSGQSLNFSIIKHF